MKKEIKSQITINAPINRVWDVLANFEAYASWSPTIRKFFGNPTVGHRTKVLLQQPNGFKIKMNPVFLKMDQNQELRWKGRLGIDGIFDGEHYFQLTAINETQTLFVQGEIFSGILVGLLKKMIDVDTLQGFELFNQAIKQEVEND